MPPNDSPAQVGLVIPSAERYSRPEDRGAGALVVQDTTPMAMLATALNRGMDAATIKDLMDLRDRWEATEAKKAFAAAMAAFKANPPSIVKDKHNAQYESMYASIGNVVNTTNAALSPHGLSASWSVDQTAGIQVTCKLLHRDGHSESVTMKGPPDDSGKKNPLQQIKSTVTYLKIATFEAVTGIASMDSAGDDDGNGNGSKGRSDGNELLSEEDIEAWQKKIEATTTKDKAKELIAEVAKLCEDRGDGEAYDLIKATYTAHLKFIASASKNT